VFNLLETRVGSFANANAAIAARAKVNALGINTARTAAPTVARTLGTRMMGTLLPRVTSFLGPVGAAVGTGVWLCSSVFKCFGGKKAVEYPPSGGLGVMNGKPVVHRVTSYYDRGASGTISVWTGSAWRVSETSMSNQGNGYGALVAPIVGEDQIAWTDNPSYSAGSCQCWAFAGVGTTTTSAPNTFPSPWAGATMVTTPLNQYGTRQFRISEPAGNYVAVQRADECPTGETCGTFPAPDDAVWPQQLRDALTANNDLDAARWLADEVDPDGGQPARLTVLAPNAHETYDDYVARLRALGLTGTITRVDLSDATMDPQRGPNEAVRTSPKTGSQVEPDAAVKVYVNPDTAPETGTGTGEGECSGSGCFPTPTFSLGPLNVPTPCSVFPFGVPCWAKDWLMKWGTVAEAPVLDLPVFRGDRLRIDLGVLDPIALIVRSILLAGGTIGMGFMFFRLAGAGGS
jgi:hypothetical protein